MFYIGHNLKVGNILFWGGTQAGVRGDSFLYPTPRHTVLGDLEDYSPFLTLIRTVWIQLINVSTNLSTNLSKKKQYYIILLRLLI